MSMSMIMIFADGLPAELLRADGELLHIMEGAVKIVPGKGGKSD